MELVPQVRHNAIQLVCPASYHLYYYISHKDASVPQIWPREGPTPDGVKHTAQRYVTNLTWEGNSQTQNLNLLHLLK